MITAKQIVPGKTTIEEKALFIKFAPESEFQELNESQISSLFYCLPSIYADYAPNQRQKDVAKYLLIKQVANGYRPKKKESPKKGMNQKAKNEYTILWGLLTITKTKKMKQQKHLETEDKNVQQKQEQKQEQQQSLLSFSQSRGNSQIRKFQSVELNESKQKKKEKMD